jgi:CO/xanthine dehydrogenase Mo-binding subunit
MLPFYCVAASGAKLWETAARRKGEGARPMAIQFTVNGHPASTDAPGATPLVAPAISSAVADLGGVRLRHSPFTPERVKQALG